jgi:hypothetical protein
VQRDFLRQKVNGILRSACVFSYLDSRDGSLKDVLALEIHNSDQHKGGNGRDKRVERVICTFRCETKSVCRLLYSILFVTDSSQTRSGPLLLSLSFTCSAASRPPLIFWPFTRLSAIANFLTTFLTAVYQAPPHTYTTTAPRRPPAFSIIAPFARLFPAVPTAFEPLAGLFAQSPSVCLCMPHKTPALNSWFDRSMV